MANDGVWTTSVNCILKAGSGAAAAAIVAANVELWIDQAESFVNAATRFNWSDAWGGTIGTPDLNVDVCFILPMTTEAIVASEIINYDKSGYFGNESQNMLDYFNNLIQRNLAILRDKKTETFINAA